MGNTNRSQDRRQLSTSDSKLGSSRLSLPSPAKINLFLHVTGRRNDGYHLLQTAFQFLDQGDWITLDVNSSKRIQRVDQHQFPLPERDLCVEAAERLRDAAGRPDLGCRITLQKMLPPGSGLGGGSSNAASVLIGLNLLWDLHLSPSRLHEIASALGADVPVFVHGSAVWAEGIGDMFTPLQPTELFYLVAVPDVAVSTESVFSAPDLPRNHPSIAVGAYRYENTTNDLQPITCGLFPPVREAVERLAKIAASDGKAYPMEPRMSGTGCAVFLPCPTLAAAKLAARSMNRHAVQHFIARGQNTSPALAAIALQNAGPD